MDLIREKRFPGNYTEEVLDVLKRLSVTNLKHVKIVGSTSVRSQQYAGDVDANDTVKIDSYAQAASLLKEVIKRLDSSIFITDFKIGEVTMWDVLQGDTREGEFDLVKSLQKLSALKKSIISEAEFKGAERLLRAVKDPLTLVEAKKAIRFHILRWKPSEVLAGVKKVRGLTISLEDAIASGGLIKLDVIKDTDRFTEISMIYTMKLNGKQRKVGQNLIESLEDDIVYFDKRNAFKALKRAFSLAKVTKNTSELEFLVPLLNSDLGRLYNIISNVDTILLLLEQPDVPIDDVHENLDEIKARMGNIYSLKEFLDVETNILGALETMKKMSAKRLKPALLSLTTSLQTILNKETEKKIKSV
jgi:hypothetical protein